ncbi:nSTAND1 domain-containing NTPase [Streptomyces silvisoli]|uniref:Trypsin-like peptidase domain-containing protein n=1 Tax=Streptomyces silvisoli TaxID=3034235 RepID=A0ABT5ZPW3_9ACTN|nr:trypsin-like peptidase domain-containing protein [Streptomyces silvisoli]MDF3291869.1 trypsin-like peptidase domain-containing protein [Streptomyces silvisoli]
MGEPTVSLSVFQVLAPEGAVAGAGFLAGEGTGFTCAHVVHAAGQIPGGRVEVLFPHLPNAPRVLAEVVAEQWRAPEAEDIAVVRLVSVPAQARGMAVGTSAGCRGHGVFSFGFPAQAPRGGHFGYGEVAGLIPGGSGAGRLLQLSKANDLTTGFSGGPVVDEITGLVIGMVTSIATPDAHGKGLGIAYATPAEVLREIRPQLAEHHACPYLGLEPFTTRHADWFHGRQDAVERVLAALGGDRRMLMLLGPSGAGKTSLINAGLLPALAGGAIPGSDRWLALSARPGQDLLLELEGAGLPGAATDGLLAAAEARLAAEPDHDHLLLVIDQFEELVTQPVPTSRQRADDKRLRAVHQLVELGGSHAAVTVLLVMRNDFYAPLDALAPDLMNCVLPGLCNIPATLSRSDLKAMITRPAAAVGLPLEANLADRIVDDVLAVDPVTRQAPVTLLPPLELALRELWVRRRRDDGRLTHAAYERIGKVTGSLTAWCNRALSQLPTEQRPIAQRILTGLVQPADEANGVPATRRPVPLTRLRALATDHGLTGHAADAAFDAVLAALTRYRIVITSTTPAGAPSGEPAAELIHDALIRGWADLRDWVAQDHQFQVWFLRASEQQSRHAHSGLPGDLLDGSLLTEGEKWAGQRTLPADIAEFLEASRQRQQSALRRTKRINVTLAGMLVLALIATVVAWDQRQTVIGQRDRAASAQVAGVAQSVNLSDPQLARRLAVASARLAATPESWSALLAARNQWETDALRLPDFVPTQSALDAAGQTLVACAGTRLEVWNLRTRTRTTAYTAPARIHQVDLSEDGRTAAVSTDDGYTRVLDTVSGRLRTPHTFHSARLADGYWPRTMISPLGSYLMVETVASDNSSTLDVWDTRNSARHLRVGPSMADFLLMDSSFSPDERVLSVPGGQGHPFTWIDMRTGRKLPVPVPYTGVKADDIVGPVVFGPDGKTAALTLKDGRISIFDRTKGWSGTELKGGSTITDDPVAFSRDGRYLVQGAIIWDLTSGASQPVMHNSITQSECSPLADMRFTPDVSKLRCVGLDGSVRTFDVSAYTDSPAGTSENYGQAVVSADRRTIALAKDGGIELWSALTRTKRATAPLPVGDSGPSVDDIQLSRDGRRLAALYGTRIYVWDTAGRTGHLLGSLPAIEEGQRSGALDAFAFSPDDKSLAVEIGPVSGTNVLTFWDLTNMHQIRQVRADLGYPDNGMAMFFQADGKSLIAAPNFGRVAFPSGRILTKGDPSMQVGFLSDDGTTAYELPRGFRPYIRFWNTRTLQPADDDLRTGTISPPLSGQDSATAVSPDGRLFATVHQSGTGYQVKVWDRRTGSELGIPLTTPDHDTFDGILALTFSPDGSTLTGVDKDGRFFTYTVAPARLIRELCTESGGLTKQEWQAHIPDSPYLKTC